MMNGARGFWLRCDVWFESISPLPLYLWVLSSEVLIRFCRISRYLVNRLIDLWVESALVTRCALLDQNSRSSSVLFCHAKNFSCWFSIVLDKGSRKQEPIDVWGLFLERFDFWVLLIVSCWILCPMWWFALVVNHASHPITSNMLVIFPPTVVSDLHLYPFSFPNWYLNFCPSFVCSVLW